MILNYEYRQFLNQKVLEYLPHNYVHVGNKLNFRCPLCGDSVKDIRKKRGWYYLNTASYYCFNCSTGMSGIKFLEHISGESYDSIRKEYTRLFLRSGQNSSLSANYEIPLNEPDIFNVQSVIKQEWKNPLSKKALDYLKSRKIIDAPFFNQNLYSCFNKDKSEEFILIPWILSGVEAYYQINDFQKLHNIKYIFPKNKHKIVAGLDNIDISFPYIFIFEGFYDSVFVKNGICVGTKAVTDYQLKLISDRYPKHQIVVAFDNDRPGIESMIKMMKSDKNFRYFRWFNKNTKSKDINELIVEKNNVNIFSDPKVLEKMIVDKLSMKMYLMQNDLWINKNYNKNIDVKNGCTSSFWAQRKIQ